MSVNKGLFTSNKEEYETPQDLFDALNEEFEFDLDAAASPENAKCPRFYTKEDDALTQPWRGTSFCNPPYGKKIAGFVKKGFGESRKYDNVVVMLLPARTDTKWWHDFVMSAEEIRFIKGRLKFGDAGNSAPFPSCIVIFDDVFCERPRIKSIGKDGKWLGRG